jgi:hypothetical protein
MSVSKPKPIRKKYSPQFKDQALTRAFFELYWTILNPCVLPLKGAKSQFWAQGNLNPKVIQDVNFVTYLLHLIFYR